MQIKNILSLSCRRMTILSASAGPDTKTAAVATEIVA